MSIRTPDRDRTRAAGLSALVTAAAFCAGDALARSFPFGPRSRSVIDLATQFVPFHTWLWDLLHGRTDGGLLVNWQSGYGSSSLPDIGTYVSSPFALLVALFPRDRIDLALYVITVLKLAVAAAAMAWLLLTLRRGRGWAAAALGSGYALCGWSIFQGAIDPMWLDGLIAFPVLCLVGQWARSGHRRLLGTALVAVIWIANFYTAYMATIGAGLVLVAHLLTSDTTVRERCAALLRAALTTAFGIGLSAPLLFTIALGTRHAYPGLVREFSPRPWTDVLARMLPATYSTQDPGVYVGTAVLLLALCLPFNRAVPARVRLVWTLLVAGTGASLQWGPTHLVWHAFTTPNGSAYRQAFIFCGLLVIAAWLCFAHGIPGPRPLLAGLGTLGLIVAGAMQSELISGRTVPTLVAGVAAVAGALVLLRLTARRHRPRLGAFAAVLLVGAQLGQATVSTLYAAQERQRTIPSHSVWGPPQERQSQLVAEADGWPRYRTEPGLPQTVGNDPLVVGGQGAQHYSSLTSVALSRTLFSLGAGWSALGRSPQSLDNPVTDAIFSIGARVHPDMTVTRTDVPPLVTVRPPETASAFGPSAFRNQEQLLGAQVYTLPSISVRRADGPPPARTGDQGYRLSPGRGAGTGATHQLDFSCPTGSEVYLWVPGFTGTARLSGGLAARFQGRPPQRGAAMQRLGTAAGPGTLTVELHAVRPGVLPEQPVGCLDPARLATAVQRLKATAATGVQVSGSGLRAELPGGSTGTAVIAVPRIAGWQCAADEGRSRPADSYLGLIAVPLDGTATRISCSFRPPGLRLGTAAAGVSLLGLLLGLAWPAVLRRLRGRRRRPAPDEPSGIPDDARPSQWAISS
ncbi:YfhO family protein [Streptomyces sp. NPDC096354]|uniref:YfhO family protein n=1 Tax=Streptomyces sp. NPDC096354 TaxID=3366088 RepID=UPI0038021828